MTGIKITKAADAWPADWHRLARIIGPVGGRLRDYWWAVEGVTWKVPIGWLFADAPPRPGSRRWKYEQSLVTRDGVTVAARPGFLPEFADVVSVDWSALYGVAADPTGDPHLLADLDGLGWFAPPAAFPPAVGVAIRSVDCAYWELFARDAELVTTVHRHARDVPGLVVERLPAG
ncbi:MAG: hypothetical protein ACAI43_01015 [Phycisphaerae bacterium]